MNQKSVIASVLTASLLIAVSRTSLAQVPITPNSAPPPLQNVQSFTIDGGPGSQFDPHVDGNLISYTYDAKDGTGNRVRYFRLGVDSAPQEIQIAFGEQDLLAHVSGSRIAYSHVSGTTTGINLFDTAQTPGSSNPMVVNPASGVSRFSPAIRGQTIAYVDATLDPNGELVVFDLSSSTATRITNDTISDLYPELATDASTVVWMRCPVDTNHCDIWKAVKSGTAWTPAVVNDDPANDVYPDTNGSVVAYTSFRPSETDWDIFYRDSAAIEHELVLPGIQAGSHIVGDLISFAGQDAGGRYDIFVYQISTNRLWNVTGTPDFDELLSGISVLPDGDVIIVYESTERGAALTNVHAMTFTVPPVAATYNICPLYDAAKAKKSDSTYPIQIRLCDASGGNLSSSSIVVHATGVTQVSTNAPGTLADTGNSNPDFDFRFDATTASYIFNLKTTGFATGTYALTFNAGTDPTVHTAMFQIK